MHVKAGLWRRVTVLFVFLVAACAVTPAVADDVPPGKSIIYLITRDTGRFSSVLVSVNGRVVGTAKPASHFVIVANPGTTEIGSAGSGRGTISLSTASGRRYYVTHSVGMSGAPEFRVLSQEEGLAAVAQTGKLAEVGSAPPSASTSRSDAGRELRSDDARLSSAASSDSFHDKQAVAIILKGGVYEISEEMQLMYAVPTLFEAKSTSAGGVEIEWRHPSGFALGGEIFYSRNNWANIIGYVGDVSTLTYTINAKYYLGIGNFVYPYIGLGAGFAVSDFSGTDGVSTYEDLSGGFAYQGLAGIEFRFKYVGINLQYKRLTADVETTFPDGSTETAEMGGSGQLVGLVIHIPIR